MFAAAITIAGSKGILHGAKIKGRVIKIRKIKTFTERFYVLHTRPCVYLSCGFRQLGLIKRKSHR